jgi:hypothetical protein
MFSFFRINLFPIIELDDNKNILIKVLFEYIFIKIIEFQEGEMAISANFSTTII